MLGSALLQLVKLPLREQSLNADNNRAMDLKHTFIWKVALKMASHRGSMFIMSQLLQLSFA